MHSIRMTIFGLLAFSPVVACVGTPEGESTDEESSAIAVVPPDGGGVVAPAPLKKCIAGPYSSSGFGNACPSPQQVAAGLCSLSGQFVGGFETAFQCSPIPGSIPQQYAYTIAYDCTRPEPCR